MSKNDNRFDTTNPLFKKNKLKQKKVKVDNRFKAILTDDRFKVAPGQIDKYGRKAKKGSKSAEKELSEFYQIDNDDDDDNKEQQLEIATSKSKVAPKKATERPKSDEDRLDYLNKLARGEIDEDSSDESSAYEHDNDEDEEEDEVEADNYDTEELLTGPGPLEIDDPEEIEVGESTNRLSILNCDWENLRAQDIM